MLWYPFFMAKKASNPDVDAFVRAVEAALRKADLRVTKQRLAIARHLAEADAPLGAYALCDRLKKAGANVNQVTVYRALEALQSIGMVHHVHQLEGYRACSADHHSAETEHAVCESCSKVIELPVPTCATDDIKKQLVGIGFEAQYVSIEITGICAQCRA